MSDAWTLFVVFVAAMGFVAYHIFWPHQIL
jgi:hypothetical protein